MPTNNDLLQPLERFECPPSTLQVTITLEEPEAGTTMLVLTQTGIPTVDRFGHEVRDADQAAEQGWKQQILQRIRAVFGYGM